MNLAIFCILVITENALSKSINVTRSCNDSVNHEANIYIIKMKDGQNHHETTTQQFNSDDGTEQINDDIALNIESKAMHNTNEKISFKSDKGNKTDPNYTVNDSNVDIIKDLYSKYSDTHHINTYKDNNQVTGDTVRKTSRPMPYIETKNLSHYENDNEIKKPMSYNQNYGAPRDLHATNMPHIKNNDDEDIENRKIMSHDDFSPPKSAANSIHKNKLHDKNVSGLKSRNNTEEKVNKHKTTLKNEDKITDVSNIREISEKLLNYLLNYVVNVVKNDNNGTEEVREDKLKVKKKPSNNHNPHLFEIHILDEGADNKEDSENQIGHNTEPKVNHELLDKQKSESNVAPQRPFARNKAQESMKVSHFNLNEPESNQQSSLKDLTDIEESNAEKLPEKSFETNKQRQRSYKSEPIEERQNIKHSNSFTDIENADDLSLETSYKDKSSKNQNHNEENNEQQNLPLLFIGKHKNRTVSIRPIFKDDTSSLESSDGLKDIIDIIKKITIPLKDYTNATITKSNKPKHNHDRQEQPSKVMKIDSDIKSDISDHEIIDIIKNILLPIKDYTNVTIIDKSTEDANHKRQEKALQVTKTVPHSKHITDFVSGKDRHSANVKSNHKPVEKMADPNNSDDTETNEEPIEEDKVGVKASHGTNSRLVNNIVRDHVPPQGNRRFNEEKKELRTNENEHNKFFHKDGYSRLRINIEIE